ncbi:hypothetical protein CO540_13180 [Micromonospora sp. WMMA2032]|uniref:hypothetical protein n=1 Tax=Micromonospora sp. WMMA2032 TaxID=2039870 RepID=UPI000C058428|nr:hypothetical protein [Micromonospora sp. WMMA2032]ATO14663.1 hypothetical protein CO540_13180 [Micromonospora sp. WMMA2032]
MTIDAYTDTKTIVERTAQAVALRHIRKLTSFDGVDIGDELYDQAETAFRTDISKALEASDRTPEVQDVRERLERIVKDFEAGLAELERLRAANAELTADAARADRLDQELSTLRDDNADLHRRLRAANAEIASHGKAVTHWAAEVERLKAELATERAKTMRVAMVKCWTNEDGKRFVFVADLQEAMGLPTEAEVA